MRAVVLEEAGRLVEREVADPVAGPGEVLVEVGACGVCRTDLQILSGDLPMRRRPVILGHQVAGRIAGTGERVGVAWLYGADGTCPACRRGLENLCPNAEFTGWTTDGGYAELIAPGATSCSRCRTGSRLQAAPLLCAGIIGYRSLRLAGAEAGGRLGGPASPAPWPMRRPRGAPACPHEQIRPLSISMMIWPHSAPWLCRPSWIRPSIDDPAADARSPG